MQPPDDFEADKRRGMTPARKARIHAAWGGVCWFCRLPVPMDGPGVEYDHVTQLWMKGSDADEDIGPIHADPCHKLKTKADAGSRAKVKRLHKKATGEKPKFHRQIRSRGFNTNIRRKMNGTVEPRS